MNRFQKESEREGERFKIVGMITNERWDNDQVRNTGEVRGGKNDGRKQIKPGGEWGGPERVTDKGD